MEHRDRDSPRLVLSRVVVAILAGVLASGRGGRGRVAGARVGSALAARPETV